MPDYLMDLLAWSVFFVIFFIGLRWYQKRKNNQKDDDT